MRSQGSRGTRIAFTFRAFELLLTKQTDGSEALDEHTALLLTQRKGSRSVCQTATRKTSGVGMRDFERAVKFTADKAVEPEFDDVQGEIKLTASTFTVRLNLPGIR